MPIACPKCQQTNAESDDHCSFCGASLTVPLVLGVASVGATVAADAGNAANLGRGMGLPIPKPPSVEAASPDESGGHEPLQPAAMVDGQVYLEVEGGQEIFYRGSYTTRVPIKGGSLLVGRRDVMANHYPDVDLMMYRKLDPAISRRHLRIFREGGEHYVEDLCNNNATFINDYSNKLNHERRILRDGDRVFVSMSLALIFRVQG